MADAENEPFANPMAPVHHEARHEEKEQVPQHPLTNDDFRKLMMTPRPGVTPSTRKPSGSSTVRGQRDGRRPVLPSGEKDDKSKKRPFFKSGKKREEDETLSELAQRYRDRAKERREGANPDYQSEDPTMISIQSSSYRSVAPDVKSADAAERRKQMIEESKYLGGDMAHTHLVKGLDYALLQKVRAEIETEDDEIQEEEADDHNDASVKGAGDEEIPHEESDLYRVKSKMALNIVNLLNQKLPQQNWLFLPSRMAYVVNLEVDEDIPTTVIRSKSDCPHMDSAATLSTNDIVINKLTQILSYLRHGTKKRKGRDKNINFVAGVKKELVPETLVQNTSSNMNIYDDLDEYKPDIEKKNSSKSKDDQKKTGRYFGEETHAEPGIAEQDLIKTQLIQSADEKQKMKVKLASRMESEYEGYAECYPGAIENEDAVMDSDEETDFSKMDAGSRRGAVGRWDFETSEEYSDYMGRREALPKAAFQYGLKMNDGRKTRSKGTVGKKDDKAKLERELQQINAILDKRKGTGGSTLPNHSDQPQTSSSHKKAKLL